MRITSMASLQDGASLAINNTLKDAEMQKRMAAYGFTPKRIEEGRSLLERFLMLQEVKDQRYDERWALSNQLKAELKSVRIVFLDHVAVARTAFRHEPVVLYQLKIRRIASKTWAWMRQADNFYTRIEDHVDRLEVLGISREALQQAKASVEAIMDMKEERMWKKGVAEDTTSIRNRAIKELHAWLMEFRGIARIALKDNPQRLESFGIRVRSDK